MCLAADTISEAEIMRVVWDCQESADYSVMIMEEDFDELRLFWTNGGVMTLNKFLLLWFSLSLSGSLAALTLIFLKPVLRRLSKSWNFYIWLLVLFRLLIPFTPDTSLVGSLFREAGRQLSPQHPVSLEEDKVQKKQNDFSPPADVTIPDNYAGQTPPEFLIPSFMANHALGVIWLVIGLFLLVRKLYAYNQFVSTVKKESRIISDGEPAQVFKRVCIAMGIKKRILVCTNPFIKAPMLIGIIKP